MPRREKEQKKELLDEKNIIYTIIACKKNVIYRDLFMCVLVCVCARCSLSH